MSASRRVAVALATASLASGCWFGPIDLVGRGCPCPAPLECHAGEVCAPPCRDLRGPAPPATDVDVVVDPASEVENLIRIATPDHTSVRVVLPDAPLTAPLEIEGPVANLVIVGGAIEIDDCTGDQHRAALLIHGVTDTVHIEGLRITIAPCGDDGVHGIRYVAPTIRPRRFTVLNVPIDGLRPAVVDESVAMSPRPRMGAKAFEEVEATAMQVDIEGLVARLVGGEALPIGRSPEDIPELFHPDSGTVSLDRVHIELSNSAEAFEFTEHRMNAADPRYWRRTILGGQVFVTHVDPRRDVRPLGLPRLGEEVGPRDLPGDVHAYELPALDEHGARMVEGRVWARAPFCPVIPEDVGVDYVSPGYR